MIKCSQKSELPPTTKTGPCKLHFHQAHSSAATDSATDHGNFSSSNTKLVLFQYMYIAPCKTQLVICTVHDNDIITEMPESRSFPQSITLSFVLLAILSPFNCCTSAYFLHMSS